MSITENHFKMREKETKTCISKKHTKRLQREKNSNYQDVNELYPPLGNLYFKIR